MGCLPLCCRCGSLSIAEPDSSDDELMAALEQGAQGKYVS